MKRIAILGARGFVGKNLTEYFRERCQVFPVTRQDFDLLDGDALRAFLEREKIDVVFHCASQGGTRKTKYDESANDVVKNNLNLFFNVEQCLGEGQRLVSFGSGAQYDKARDLVKVREEDLGKQIPRDDYGFAKFAMDRYIRAKGAGNICEPIIFGLYGKYEDYTFKFISNAIVKHILGMPIVINQNVCFDYLYLGDFLRIMERLAEGGWKHPVFNITPSQPVDLVRIAEIINACGDHESEIVVRNPGMNYQYTGDNGRLLENVGGDFEFTSYEQGIAELYAYYEGHMDSLDVEAVREDGLMRYCKTK